MILCASLIQKWHRERVYSNTNNNLLSFHVKAARGAILNMEFTKNITLFVIEYNFIVSSLASFDKVFMV